MTSRTTIAMTGQSLIKHDTRNISVPAFKEIVELLKTAELSFTNFEGTILGRHGGWPLKGSFFDCSEPFVLDALREMGFGALSLSNNHAFDLGPSGILSTLEEVEKRGFVHAGIGRNHQDAAQAGTGVFGKRKIAVVAMDGGPGPDFMYADDARGERPERPGINRLGLSQVVDVDAATFDELRAMREKVGYTDLAYVNDSQPNDPLPLDEQDEICIARAVFRRSRSFARSVKIDGQDLARNLAMITTAAEEGSLVIAYLHHHHWAPDWLEVPEWVESIARNCIDAGAAAFVSHGAPVLQGVQLYRNRPIFYSMGNFIFHVPSEEGTWRAPEVWESVIGMCTFDQDSRLVEAVVHPLIIGGEHASGDTEHAQRLVPELAKGRTADRILRRLAAQSARFGTVIEISNGCGVLRI
ncbi:CapA family protein [Brucella intermedia]|uniref:CapA family protein n=1 Tax=Brucella intermedia TaxID=94625 RepID=UPI00235FFEBF|nr:CapA family protein [Brucella intermedia]